MTLGLWFKYHFLGLSRGFGLRVELVAVDKDRKINSRFVSYVVSNLQVPLCVGICFDGIESSKNPWKSFGEDSSIGDRLAKDSGVQSELSN